MNQYKQRIAVQSTILNYINQLMIENDLSPSLVEDAMNKVIIQLHPLIIQEILNNQDDNQGGEEINQEEVTDE